jgi:hypothetical protein
MRDIVTRLRVHPIPGTRPPIHGALRNEAADEIDRLRAENEALREAAGKLANAADAVGIKHFDTDTFTPEVGRMLAATLDLRALLEKP